MLTGHGYIISVLQTILQSKSGCHRDTTSRTSHVPRHLLTGKKFLIFTPKGLTLTLAYQRFYYV